MRLFVDIRKHLIPIQPGIVATDHLFGTFHGTPEAGSRSPWLVLGGIALGVSLVAMVPLHSRDEADADQLLHRAEAGSASSQLMLGLAYRDGRYGLPRDDRAAATWLARAARSGNAYAAATLGDAYAQGQGVAPDIKVAQRWWLQAAQADNVHAESRLGLSLLHSATTQAQQDAGRRWLDRAAMSGDVQAQTALGIETPTATPIADRIDRDLGTGVGHSLLGNLYRLVVGETVPGQSVENLKQHALAGDNVAEFQLAMRYSDGSWGVNADPKLALGWLRRAADHGNPVAMASLANAYTQGQFGLKPDPATAEAWRQRAAAAGGETFSDNR